MSDNPKTAAWKRRASRLAKEMSFDVSTVGAAVERIDPNASGFLIRTALTMAEDACRARASELELWAARERRHADYLRDERASRSRPVLQVVPHTRAGAA
jgi:hypothetical protein